MTSCQVRYNRCSSAIIRVSTTFVLVHHSAISAWDARDVRPIRRWVNELRATLHRCKLRYIRFRLNNFATRYRAGIISCRFMNCLVRRFKGSEVRLSQRGKETKLRNKRVSFSRSTAQTKDRRARIVACLVRLSDRAPRHDQVTCRTKDVQNNPRRVVHRFCVRSHCLARDNSALFNVFQFNNSSNSGDHDARVSYRGVLYNGVRILRFVPRGTYGTIRDLSRYRQCNIFRLNAPRFSSVNGFYYFLTREFGRCLGVFCRFRINMMRSSIGNNEVDIVNELQAIRVVIKQAMLVLPSLVSRWFRHAINGRFINIRVHDDAHTSLGRICQRLIIVFPFRCFFANLRSDIHLFFHRRIRFTVNGNDSRFYGDWYLGGREVFVRIGLASTGIFGAARYLRSMRYAFQRFAAACRITFYADFF